MCKKKWKKVIKGIKQKYKKHRKDKNGPTHNNRSQIESTHKLSNRLLRFRRL